MKKILCIILTLMLLAFAGCTNDKPSNNYNYEEKTEETNVLFRSIKIESDNISSIYYGIDSVIGELYTVSYADETYYPELILRYNEKGKLENFTVMGYFLDDKDDYRWADEALYTYEMSTAKLKNYITSAKKGRINDFVSYVKYDFKYSNDYYYNFNQFIDTYLIARQDIEKFKEETYYSRLYNYETAPECIDDEGHFYCPLELLDVYWANDEKAFDKKLD